MNNYVFYGLNGWDNNWYEFCVQGTNIDNAWERVAIYYPEFSEVKFLRQE